ncbi:early endosome antigen 1 isoform X2 [Chlorella sorokiniana]|uniref:Early endosome antigen 1 isoform X2 n=1 Tax=Chlorella sorokiniana TaxID=3076 RepID=A0A2P6U033_CHLSO|nr:early endosome antigen 1 isoform X2 [Chlorella sorokiniana]|eukprot:PRW59673.1 early endosome antigen 1 isoform X2 [Chlorella sorokiniana]
MQQEGQRRGSLPPAPPPSAGGGGERRPSLGTAALANLKGLGARVVAGVMGGSGSSGRRPSRMSFAAPAGGSPQAGSASRRGSLAPAAVLAAAAEAAAEGQDSGGSATALHPGLDRIKSFNRKKSFFRAGGKAATGVDDLWAAMDALDQRIMTALAAAREANAAGLGRVRGLSQTKSMRLRPSAAPTAAASSQAEDAGEDEAYSPRALLGAEAAERPDTFLLRVKFIFKAQPGPPLHEGGCSTARGRLEGNGDDVPEAAGLIPAVRQCAPTAEAGSGEQQQQQPGGPQQPPAEAATPPEAQRPRGVRWGATEGGLDRLGWVRNLVQFSEFKQQQGLLALPAGVPQPGGPNTDQAPAGLTTIGWLESGAGLNGGGSSLGSSAAGQGRPAPPRTREEVALLQAWLQDMMGQVIAQACGQQAQRPGLADATADAAAAAVAAMDASPGPAQPGPQQGQQQSAADLADAALWVYGLAFEELQRQVGTECGERGTLLGGMWQHTFSLVELRCSLVYEGIIAAIRDELAAARQRASAAAASARASEERVKESMYYSRDKFAAMEAEVKHLAQLLAAAEEETARHAEEAALLHRAHEAQAAQAAAAEERAAEQLRQRLDLQHRVEELETAAAERAGVMAAQEAELAQLRGDLARAQTEGRALTEDKARLEVEAQRSLHDFRTAEVLGMSLREQLAAREAELRELDSRHSALQAEQAATSAALQEAQASLSALRQQHEGLQASSSQQAAQQDAALAAEQEALAEAQHHLAATEAERQALQKGLEEATAREVAVTAQLKQLAGAHEQQTGKLRQETDARRNADDELAAIRAGLQVTQQRLEGLGLVFASNAAHRTAAEAWRATGPISMARQVVAAVNQQLGGLATQRAELQHELGAAKERWQAEEAVRIRLQEQLLEVKAREAKLSKERESLEGAVARLEAQRAGLDAELAQMRRMLEDAEARCQASHKAAMEAANEAKRLAPLEPRAARLEEAVAATGQELERVQREVTSHQQTIRELLAEKSTALEQLAARSQALDAAQLQVRELTTASHDRLQLTQEKAQLEEELHSLRQRCSATERLQGESMHQLSVARRLLADAASAEEHSKLASALQELQSSKAAVAAQRRESLLLKDRLSATQDQLQFMERQLQVAVHAPLAAAVAAATGVQGGSGGGMGAAPGGGGSSGVVPAVVDQLRRLLDTKEERIKQLERLQGTVANSAAQMKQLTADLASRDSEVAALREEVESTRRRLHALQESQAKAATKDLVALAAADPGLPPDVAQALAVDYARSHLRSELAWTKAKLVVLAHMASGLRTKLAQAQAERAQAEMESVCVEAFYLEQALMDQRAFAAAFDATFAQVKRVVMAILQGLTEMRRQLLAPAATGLPRLAEQAGALSAALAGWVARFEGRTDQCCQADPLGEVEAWRSAILGSLPAVRPTSPPPLQHVSSLIVQVYVHRLRSLPLQGPEEPGLAENVFEAMARFFCERRGFSRDAVLFPTGPVAALLAGTRAHLQQPKQLLLGRLAGLAPSGGSGRSRSLQHPEAWHFFVRLLCCLRALQGAGWDALAKEWAESEEGVPLPLPCVMDVLANLFNTDAPALLDSMRRGLVPLVRQGRRGPALDLDAFLLVALEEYSDGNCPRLRSASPDGGSPAAGGGSRSAAVISGMRELAANPDLPLGLHSSLRASAPSGSPKK